MLFPLNSGVIAESDIRGDLHALRRNQVPDRSAEDDRTLFKSVGTAIEDLTAAQLVVSSVTARQDRT